MFLLFFLVWVVFNGKLTLEIGLIGAGLCALLYAFCCAFLGYHPRKDAVAFRRIGKFLRYACTLLWEIIKCNVQLTRMVYNPNLEFKPQLVTFRTPLQGAVSKAVLADSITCTPGTITVLAEGDELTIHCLDASFAQGIEDTVFQRQLMQIEEGGRKHEA